MPSNFQGFAPQNLDRAADTLRAVAHDVRIKMLELLDGAEWVNVQQFHTDLNLEPSLASQHLRILRRADIVTTRREGKLISYRLNEERFARIRSAVGTFISRSEPVAAQA